MIIATSWAGVSVVYKCRRAKYAFFKKCPDESRTTCMHCKWCIAEIPAPDATRIMSAYRTQIRQKGGD